MSSAPHPGPPVLQVSSPLPWAKPPQPLGSAPPISSLSSSCFPACCSRGQGEGWEAVGEQGRQTPPFLWCSAEGLVRVLADGGCWRLSGRGGIARGLRVPRFSVRWGRRRRRWGDERAPVHPPTAPLALHPLDSAPTRLSILLRF